jgi:aspartyl-tRNA synthetase
MLLTDAASIREVIPFPMVRARQPATACGDHNQDHDRISARGTATAG